MTEKEYLEFISNMPCTKYGTPSEQNHHPVSFLTGTSKKCSDWLAFPLSLKAHREIHQNTMDEEKLLAKHIQTVVSLFNDTKIF